MTQFTVQDSQELAAIISPETRAKTWANAMHKAPTIETYWAAVDAYVAGWQACEDLYEGRSHK